MESEVHSMSQTIKHGDFSRSLLHDHSFYSLQLRLVLCGTKLNFCPKLETTQTISLFGLKLFRNESFRIVTYFANINIYRKKLVQLCNFLRSQLCDSLYLNLEDSDWSVNI